MGESGSAAERRLGVGFGIAAYGAWGLFPLYWPLLEPAGAGEILAHRMAWSLLAVLVLLALRRVPDGTTRWGWVRQIVRAPRKLALLAGAAVAISVNWFVYIWSVNHGHTVDTAFGYFINPLVTVLFGVFLLRERLRRLQWAAVGVGAVAVVVLALGYGKAPWIALVLAGSFGTYGLLKKLVAVPAAEAMAVESSLQFVPAVGYLVWLGTHGTLVFGQHAGNTALLMLAGPVTVLPLIAFGAAANRLPLSMVGLLQFLAPILQFLCGVLVQHEAVPPARLAGFLIVWAALVLLTVDALRAARRSGRGDLPGQSTSTSDSSSSMHDSTLTQASTSA
ncbi:EamA family transporter RarD [Catenulispora sp. NL8]|uniref:EamA family transporter RarD n=1 Tax=Catenulispora pinistramenti TaxID=2705254 RepID=A0ABS5KLB3_9ACTN|nr:EamA family transporter RarD [Catenulispora pinistramenti]MBS2546829.1 EamA family transporter RarD [Catenulispora pinistramenti]